MTDHGTEKIADPEQGSPRPRARTRRAAKEPLPCLLFADQRANAETLVAQALLGHSDAQHMIPRAIAALSQTLTSLTNGSFEDEPWCEYVPFWMDNQCRAADFAAICERASHALAGTPREADGLVIGAEGRRVSEDLLSWLECDEGFGAWQGDARENTVRARYGRLLDASGLTATAYTVRMRGLWRQFAGTGHDAELWQIELGDPHHLAEMLANLAADLAGRCGREDERWIFAQVARGLRTRLDPDLFPWEDVDFWPRYETWKAANAAPPPSA